MAAGKADFRWMLGNCEDLFGCGVPYRVLIGGGCVYPPPVADSRGSLRPTAPRRGNWGWLTLPSRRGTRKRAWEESFSFFLFLEMGHGRIRAEEEDGEMMGLNGGGAEVGSGP